MGEETVGRRGFLRGAGAIVAGAGGGAALAACGAGSSNDDGAATGKFSGPSPAGTASRPLESSRSGSTSASLQLPKFAAYEGVPPDLPGLDNGTSAYFSRFPAKPARFSASPPGDGKAVTTLTIMNSTVKPVGGNRHWQAVNKALGVDFQLNGVPIAGYVAKFETLVASDDLPDLTVVLPTLMHGLPDLLKARFQDLSEHLAGDKVAQYPGLANLPTYCWRGAVYNHGIAMIPIHRFALKRGYLVRSDLADAAGANPMLKNGDDLLGIAKAFGNPKKNKFLCVVPWGLVDLVNEMMGTPNQWAVADGKFTKDYESETFPKALDVVRQLWADNRIHPDGFGANAGQLANSSFYAGNTICRWAGSRWSNYAVNAEKASPEATTVAFPVPTWDGAGEADRWLTNGAPYMVALKKASADRIAMLLKVINVMAAPFGTEEYALMEWGVEGVDYTVDAGGAPVLTDQGNTEKITPIVYCGSPALVHYNPGSSAYAKAEYGYEKAAMDRAAPLPTVGLDSPTDLKEGSVLAKKMQDLQSDIIQGRKPVSAWKEGVKSWRSGGGDAIRAEYEKAYAEANA